MTKTGRTKVTRNGESFVISSADVVMFLYKGLLTDNTTFEDTTEEITQVYDNSTHSFKSVK